MTEELLKTIRNLLWLILAAVLLLTACVALRMDRDLQGFIGLAALLAGVSILIFRTVACWGGKFLRLVKGMDEEEPRKREKPADPEGF